MSDASAVKLRQSVRALIMDEFDRVLLVRFEWPTTDGSAVFWANPGGGIEPGESRLDALRRELVEEVGIAIGELGPEVWTKTALFDNYGHHGQVDHIHLQRVAHVDPAPSLSVEELGSEHLHGVRWWTRAELEESSETFAPRTLPALYADLLRHGPPSQPVLLTGF